METIGGAVTQTKAVLGSASAMTSIHWTEAEVKPVIELLARRWVLTIVRELWWGEAVRRVDLRRRLGSISDKSLTSSLRELESAGFVSRSVYEEVPPRVEYALTDYGRSLEPLLAAVTAWGLSNSLELSNRRA